MFTLNQIHSYNTRSSKLFRVARTRTKLRQFSIKYQGPTTFNSLSNEIKESLSYSSLTKKLKVTVHVGTDQNIEIEIFAEYKYTLNKLPVKILFFQYV